MNFSQGKFVPASKFASASGMRVCILEKEMLKISVEEFSRLQTYMLSADKESETYKIMKLRYIELKVILTASGINLTELDRIKE